MRFTRTAVRATEIMPYPKNNDTQDKVCSTPYPNTRHPAEVTRKGTIIMYNRLSGSKTPWFFFVRHAHQLSTRLPTADQHSLFDWLCSETLTSRPRTKDIAQKSWDVNQAVDLWTPVVRWCLKHERVQDVDSYHDDKGYGIAEEGVYHARIYHHWKRTISSANGSILK
jgi:hypothetical protein